jgi:hypothetical protein
MNYKNAIRNVTSAAVILGAVGLGTMTAMAQDKTPAKKPVVTERTSGRDPFKRYAPVVKMGKAVPTRLEAPTIQMRIERYRAQKLAAANAHVAPPKPTSVLLLNEMQVNSWPSRKLAWYSAVTQSGPTAVVKSRLRPRRYARRIPLKG